MKRIILILLLCLPMIAGAQTYSEIQTRLNANIWQDGTRFQTNTYRRFYSDTLNSLLNDMLDFTNSGFLPLTLPAATTVNLNGKALNFGGTGGSFRVTYNAEVGGTFTLGLTSTTGNDRTINAAGSEDDINIILATKGDGKVVGPSGMEAFITNGQDIANKAYVDSIAGASGDFLPLTFYGEFYLIDMGLDGGIQIQAQDYWTKNKAIQYHDGTVWFIAFNDSTETEVLSSLSITSDGGVEIQQLPAFYYQVDRSTMTTDRHIPDIGWVKGYVDTAAVGGSSYTFENGLTESGGTVKIGGDVTEATTISLADDASVSIGDFLTKSGGYIGVANVGDSIVYPFIIAYDGTDVGKYGALYFDYTKESAETTSSTGGIYFKDTRPTKYGIEYAGDYTAGLSQYSLTPRAYVDARAKLSKYDATAAPGTGDDANDGYTPGSQWVDITNKDAYICVDATVGAAVWKKITP
jgi:hypothetical protein